MKPALETISLGKGGVTQPKQHRSFSVHGSGAAPALAVVPRPLQAKPNHSVSRNSFPRLTRRQGGSLPCHSTPSPTRPGYSTFHQAPRQHPTLLRLLIPDTLSFPEFLPKARLRFPSRCPGMGSLTYGCCQGQELLGLQKPSCPMDTRLFLTKKCQKAPLNVSPNKLLFATSVHK